MHYSTDFGFPGAEENGLFTVSSDILFILDVVLTFYTGYDSSNGDRVWNPTLIMREYIASGWFWVDAVACFPFELLVSMSGAESSGGSGGGSRIKLLLRVLKLPRLLRLGKVFRYLDRFHYAAAWKVSC